MTRTRPNERVETCEFTLANLKFDVTRALEHIQRELAGMDWHSGENADETGVRTKGGEPPSPAERVALERYEFTSKREDIRDGIDAVEQVVRSLRIMVDKALGMRTAHTELFDATEYGKRCKHPTCEQWASEHRLPLTSTVSDLWCDLHWHDACMIHGDHAHEGRRVDGVLACQAAYKKHQRETLKETA